MMDIKDPLRTLVHEVVGAGRFLIYCDVDIGEWIQSLSSDDSFLFNSN